MRALLGVVVESWENYRLERERKKIKKEREEWRRGNGSRFDVDHQETVSKNNPTYEKRCSTTHYHILAPRSWASAHSHCPALSPRGAHPLAHAWVVSTRACALPHVEPAC